jgi:hypothetical protein
MNASDNGIYRRLTSGLPPEIIGLFFSSVEKMLGHVVVLCGGAFF